MYNLNLGSVRNFAKAISTGRTTINRRVEEQTGAASADDPCLRTASLSDSDTVIPDRMHCNAMNLGYDHAQEGEDQDDPLIYRLQHQQRYVKEKQLRKGGELMTINPSRRSSQRDPFDLCSSFTSEDASLYDKSNRSGVDVVGWGECNSFQQKESSHSSDDDKEESTDELYVDFGGGTPGGKVGKSCIDNIYASDAMPIPPPESSSPLNPSSQWAIGHNNLHLNYQRKRISAESDDSNFPSASKYLPNNSYISGGNDGRSNCRPSASYRPSHEDLSHILSSLERATETLSSSPPSPKPGFGASSCDSTLSSPTSKCRRSLSISSSSSHENQHVSSVTDTPHKPPFQQQRDEDQCSSKQQASTLPQQLLSPLTPLQQQLTQKQKNEEEEDPRLAQLNQQTLNELHTELSKMQAQSKNNLESLWAETERLRVENSELEDELAEAKMKLDQSRAAAPSQNNNGAGRQPGTPSVSSGNNSWNKVCSPGKGIRRSTSAVATSEETESNSSIEFRTMPMLNNLKGSVGKCHRNKRRCNAGAVNSLTSSADDAHETASITRSCSDKPNGGLFVDLGKGFRGMKSSGGSESSRDSAVESDFDCGFDMNIDENSRFTDFDGNSEKQNPIDQGDDFYVGDDASSCAKSAIFYPHPGKEEESWNSILPEALSAGRSEMDDFDFDPLSENTRGSKDQVSDIKSANERIKERSGSKCRSSLMSLFEDKIVPDDDEDSIGSLSNPPEEDRDNKSVKGRTKERSGFKRRPSLMSLFEDKSAPDDEDSSASSSNSPPQKEDRGNRSSNERTQNRRGFKRRPNLMSLFENKLVFDDDEDSSVSSSDPPRQKKDRAAMTKELILAKGNEIELLMKKIRSQVDDMQEYGQGILNANVKCGEDHEQLKSKESILQSEIKELEKRDSGAASESGYAEESEQHPREKENALREKLATLKEVEHEVQLKKQLSCHQDQYSTSQENAISSLSSLLDDFEAMRIPSLRGEMEDNVCGDIIARFEDLTDKEEELVELLSDSDRLVSCQALFQQIQQHIEIAMSWQNQLGLLETDLHSYLVTITMLIEQDDEGTHTTESSTASERLSLERVFVEAIILHLGLVKQNQGKQILDALSKSVEFLTNWDQWLLPDFAMSPPPSKSSCGDLGTSVSPVIMLKDVVKKATAELAAVKSDVMNEQAMFQAKMKTADLPYHISNDSYVKTTVDGIGFSYGDDSEERGSRSELDELRREISQQISVTKAILSDRESLTGQYSPFLHPEQEQVQESTVNFQLIDEIFDQKNVSEQLRELDKEIFSATKTLLEKESLRNKYSSEFGLMQAQASKDSNSNLQMLNETQMEMKHVLAKFA